VAKENVVHDIILLELKCEKHKFHACIWESRRKTVWDRPLV